VPLFEHEFFKHASCTPFRQSASQFVQQVMRLYDAYYATHVENRCAGYKQLWLNLDCNFAYNNVTKCIWTKCIWTKCIWTKCILQKKI
jgi:hypothetical protein